MDSGHKFYPFTSVKEKDSYDNKIIVLQNEGYWSGYVALTRDKIPNLFRGFTEMGTDDTSVERCLNIIGKTLSTLKVCGDIDYFRIHENNTVAVFGFCMKFPGWEIMKESNPEVYKTVSKLMTVQMESQIIEFDKFYPEWVKSDFERQVGIIEQIRKKGHIEVFPGFYQNHFIRASRTLCSPKVIHDTIISQGQNSGHTGTAPAN